MEGSNKKGKYAMFSTFTFNQHINIFMIKIVWGIISRSNNPDSITHYISMILTFFLKFISAIFSIQKLCKAFLFFLVFHAMAIYLS